MNETSQTEDHDEKFLRQRLVVCLDGSWNKRGSGTNIYHISNLVQKGKVTKDGETWRQRVYYDEGVGTGILDRISGGAFGIGVSENVRQAYDWLVEKYNDGDDVYIFGFSRGAFTARSLVGLISKCGLVYRGAPIPQQQLWEGYQKLGSKSEWRNDDNADKWARRVNIGDAPFRLLKFLKVENRKISFRPLKFFKNDDGTKVDPPGAPANHTEELLFDWSRRIPIKCLGVFDSVGTFGVEAVAIPWLQERRAQFHDTGLSSCVEYGFHALAINEYRANFSHIPWRRSAGQGPDEKIKQCWFIGAHTNVGGGCSDNALAQFPLRWMLFECDKLGLQFRPPADDLEPVVERVPEDAVEKCIPYPVTKDAVQKCIPLHSVPEEGKSKSIPGNVGDSFSEFMGGVWRYALRNKPNYRWIKPPLEFQHGQAVKSNEEVDPSVAEIVREDQGKKKRRQRDYEPPNLWAYWNRPREDAQRSPDSDDRKILDDTKSPSAEDKKSPDEIPRLKKPKHEYLDNWTAGGGTLVWFLGIGLAGYLFGYLKGGRWWFLVAIIAPFFALTADYGESWWNHHLALNPQGKSAERRRSVYLDKLLNIRLFFLGASLVGIIFFLVSLVKWLSFCVPAWEVLWLFGLALIAVRLKASWDWSALPIAELGDRFGGWFYYVGYAKRFPIPSAPPNNNPPDDINTTDLLKVRQSWRKRALLRDLVGFIPASFIAIGFGWWLTLSLIFRMLVVSSAKPHIWGGLNLDPRCWIPAALVALVYLIFAIVANGRQRPDDGAVLRRSLLFSPERVLFWAGIVGFFAAIVVLALHQVWRVCDKLAPLRWDWAKGFQENPLVDRFVIPGDELLPEWLAVVAVALAISCLCSAIKQKRSQESANPAE